MPGPIRVPIAVFAAFATAFAADSARSQAPAGAPRVLVMPFSVEADQTQGASASAVAWLGEAAAILLADGLGPFGFDPFSRDERVRMFDRLQLPMRAALTRATTIRAGELAGAALLVVGDIRAGDTLSVHARLIRLATAEQVAEIRETGAATELSAILDRLAASLARAAGDGCAACRRMPPLPRMAPDVFENYVRGLVAIAPAARRRLLEIALPKAPRDPRLLLALWEVYSEQGLHARALAAARTVTVDSAWIRRARFCAALTLIELGRSGEALAALEELEADRPAAVLANAIGVVHLRRGAADAARHFKRAVDLAPADPDFLFNLGYASALARDAATALTNLREVVRLDATDGDAHRVMSAVLEAEGRSAESRREFELAALLGAPSAAPGSAREKVPPGLERLRDDLDAPPLPQASALAGSGANDQEQVAAFHLDEARRLIAARRDRDAFSALRKAVYLSPYRDEPHLLLGQLHERAGRLPEAIDEFRVALWCRESAAGRVALGAALLATGDKVAARSEAQRALALEPASAEARALLARIDR